MKYEFLSEQDQQEFLKGRLRQIESEHYSHTILLDQLNAAKAAGDNSEPTEQAIKNSEDALKILDQAHAEAKKKVKK